MIRELSWRHLLVTGLTTLVCAAPVQARNTKLLLPIAPALATPQARKVLADNGVTMSFGAALPGGLKIVRENLVERGKADPRKSKDPGDFRSAVQVRSDEETCQEAFVSALEGFAKHARRSSATSVVGVVSYYEGAEFDSSENYECHAGQTRAVVEMRAHLAAVGQPNEAGLTTAGMRFGAFGSGTTTTAQAGGHRSAIPSATGFARGDDVKAVPISDAGKERYRHYLTLPSPKAFVIFDDGAWRFYSNDVDAMTKALGYCERERKTCWLYAVDDRVVWSDNVAKRIGKASQLGNE